MDTATAATIESLRQQLDAARTERDEYRDSLAVTTTDNNATFDGINKALDAAGITFRDVDTYAACINRLAAERDATRETLIASKAREEAYRADVVRLTGERDAARQALNDTDLELAKAMSRAEYLAAALQSALDSFTHIATNWGNSGDACALSDAIGEMQMEASQSADKIRNALDPAKFEGKP